MTTTPTEPEQNPDVVPAGDPAVGPDDQPGSPAEPDDLPDTEGEPGQMPESTNPEVGA